MGSGSARSTSPTTRSSAWNARSTWSGSAGAPRRWLAAGALGAGDVEPHHRDRQAADGPGPGEQEQESGTPPHASLTPGAQKSSGLWKNLVVPEADELALTERLISYDTSHPEGIRAAVGFVKGWLDARGIAHREYDVNGLPALVAAVGDGPATLVWNSHVDVVPARGEQFSPWRVDGKLYGRGAYDMKGALGAMLAALADLARAPELIPKLKVKLLVVPDEEAEEDSAQGKASAFLADEGHLGQFVICGEPTNLEIGVQSKGVLVCRFDVSGRSAHGATPWLGDN